MEHYSVRHSLKQNWLLLFIGSIFSFYFASVLLSGWPAGLSPNLSYPYIYGDDSIFMSWEIQRLLEGWIFDNPRSGYPFGSQFLDYPHSDTGNLLVLKLFGMLTHSYYGAMNLYLLTGFPVVFIASFLVFKAFRFRSIYAFIAALLFSFTPFHLWRLFGHIYYTWYFVIPIYFLYGWKIFFSDPALWPLNTIKKIILSLGSLIILSSFGFYYAFFGIITFLLCGMAAFIRTGRFQSLFLSIILSGMLLLGLGLNLSPTLLYIHKQGKNPEVGTRLAKETEMFSLKLAHLFFPLWNHRIEKFRKPFERYIQNFDVSEATFSSSLGLLSSLGFLILMYSIFSAALGRQIDIRLGLLAMLVLSYLFIASVGSLNVFFALITPMIRGWNRISIFISFAALTALFLALQENKPLNAFLEKNKVIFFSFPCFILALGLLDQTPRSLYPLTLSSKNSFFDDREFIQKIESIMPVNAAIYQLPYMGFPEYGRLEQLSDYELAKGFINSKTLKWSHAGIKGRDGDLFYRHLSKEPLEKQLMEIKRLGFTGLYIDRRGFNDNAKDLIAQLEKLGYEPNLVKKDNQVLFYHLSARN